jgi:hypothetical protein
MKARLVLALCVFLGTPIGQAFACSQCFGAADSKSTEHMAAAIWVMLGVIMSVMGGVGAFSFHLWKHAHTPLEPHQQLTDEDLKPYE